MDMFIAPSLSFAVTSPDVVLVQIKEAQREQQGCFVDDDVLSLTK